MNGSRIDRSRLRLPASDDPRSGLHVELHADGQLARVSFRRDGAAVGRVLDLDPDLCRGRTVEVREFPPPDAADEELDEADRREHFEQWVDHELMLIQDRATFAVRCSFCEKLSTEVRKMIAGPTTYICDECVQRCTDVLASEDEDRAGH